MENFSLAEFQKAKEVLGLETDLFTGAELKRAYIKRAIVCHPDKNKGTPESTMQFQELQSSYAYLSSFVLQDEHDTPHPSGTSPPHEPTDPTPTENGEEILTFVQEVLQGKYQQVLLDLVCGIKHISLHALEKISKHQLQKVYDFLQQYGQALFIPADIIQVVRDLLLKKQSIREILYTVSPTLNDLLGDKLYKLTLENTTYLVPLWHKEVWYDGKTEGEDIIVSCHPTLPENITLDADNNLYVTVRISLNSSLLNEAYTVTLGKKTFTLPVSQLHVTSATQKICLPNCGILRMNEDNFYDLSKRSHVYFLVQFI
jgi:curved DNA-binding protein CbpA